MRVEQDAGQSQPLVVPRLALLPCGEVFGERSPPFGVHFPPGLGPEIGFVRSTFLLIVILPLSAPAPFTVTNRPDFESRTVVVVELDAVLVIV